MNKFGTMGLKGEPMAATRPNIQITLRIAIILPLHPILCTSPKELSYTQFWDTCMNVFVMSNKKNARLLSVVIKVDYSINNKSVGKGSNKKEKKNMLEAWVEELQGNRCIRHLHTGLGEIEELQNNQFVNSQALTEAVCKVITPAQGSTNNNKQLSFQK